MGYQIPSYTKHFGLHVNVTTVVGLGVANLLITEGESSAELDGSSLPPLVVEEKILVL